MKLENQVVSLELAKELKELGVKQESYFDWEIGTDDKPYVVKAVPERLSDEYRLFSAFTVAELGEILPDEVKSRIGIKKVLIIHKVRQGKDWQVRYTDLSQINSDIFEAISHTEANARAKMLIYLIKNKLIKL